MSNPPVPPAADYSNSPAPAKLSKAALCSLIFGVLGCIPFFAGAMAMLFGIIGFITAGKPGMKGRWMAVLGGLLGLLSIVLWIAFFGSIVALVLGLTGPPKTASHDFIRDLSSMPMAELDVKYGQFSTESLENLQNMLKTKGTFVDTTFPSVNIRNTRAFVRGTAKFTNETLPVELELENADGQWKITSIDFDPGNP